MTVKLVYLAWVRERIGVAEELRDIPVNVTTVAQLMAWLADQGPGYAQAFAEPTVIRTAIDRAHVAPDALIADAREIAFFPPVTGG